MQKIYISDIVLKNRRRRLQTLLTAHLGRICRTLVISSDSDSSINSILYLVPLTIFGMRGKNAQKILIFFFNQNQIHLHSVLVVLMLMMEKKREEIEMSK
jgi:hypothetical protein